MTTELEHFLGTTAAKRELVLGFFRAVGTAVLFLTAAALTVYGIILVCAN